MSGLERVGGFEVPSEFTAELDKMWDDSSNPTKHKDIVPVLYAKDEELKKYWDDIASTSSNYNPVGMSTSDGADFVWKTLQTTVSFPGWLVRKYPDIVPGRMTKEVAKFKSKMGLLMGSYAMKEDAHEGIQATAKWTEDADYEILLQSTLKVHLQRLEEYLAERKREEKEDQVMRAADFVFEVMVLETPEQWKQVKAIPGELFQFPKVIIPMRTVVAEDLNSAKKEALAEAFKMEGVVTSRLEVLGKPFLG